MFPPLINQYFRLDSDAVYKDEIFYPAPHEIDRKHIDPAHK
jgi:hypothetical protein